MPTQLPRVPSLIPSSLATRAIGRDVSITIFTASSLNSGEKLFLGRGNYFTFPDGPSYWMDCPEGSGHLTVCPTPPGPQAGWPDADRVGLGYWIWPGRTSRLGSSLSDHFGRLPACTSSARLSDGADPAPAVQGRRALGAPARDRGASPPDRPGPLPAGRPAVAGRTVATGSPPPAG